MNHLIRNMIDELEQNGRLHDEKKYIQHGNTTVYAHSVNVASFSLRLAEKLNLRIDKRSLVRGALLHDYFLYDWHDKNKEHSLHGFFHPKTALNNAKFDYLLTQREENIISRHMFPLTPVPPTCREAWLVCVADKYCAVREMFSPDIRKG